MDISYLLFLQNIREATGGILNGFLSFITNIAIGYFIMIPAFIIFWCVDKKKGIRILSTCGMAVTFNVLMKNTFCVYRPWIKDSRVIPLGDTIRSAPGYSFPSGHSTSAAGFYCPLIIAYRKYKGICVFAVVMVLLTMFSRNYIGVHTPQDVVFGCLTGVFAAIMIDRCIAYLENNSNKDWIFVLITTIAVGILLLYICYKSYPMDYMNGELVVDSQRMSIDGFKEVGRFYGIIIGWFLERRFINFSTEGTPEQKTLRGLVGAFLYLFVWTTVCESVGKLIDSRPVYFVLQAGCQILFMTVYPMVFTKFHKNIK